MNRSTENRILLVHHDSDVAGQWRGILNAGADASAARNVARNGSLAAEVAEPPFDVEWASSGFDAWQAVRQSLDDGRPYALAILGLRMPDGWDGLETSRRIRDIDPEILQAVVLPEDCTAADVASRQMDHASHPFFLQEPLCPCMVRQAVGWQLEHLALREELQSTLLALEYAEHNIHKLHEASQSSDALYNRIVRELCHHVRSPMHSILGFSASMMKTVMKPKDARRLRQIHNAGTSLFRMMDEVLDFTELSARQTVLEMAPLGVDSLLRDAARAGAEMAAGKEMRIITGRDATIPRDLVGDERQVSKVLLRLLDNAVKYSSKGVVRLECSVLAVCETSATLRYAVSDEGPGIPLHAQRRLFEHLPPGTDAATDPTCGIGLGLIVCRQLVELMGGRIGVDSRPGEGTTFWFTVPFGRQANANAPGRRRQPAEVAHLPLKPVPCGKRPGIAPAEQRPGLPLVELASVHDASTPTVEQQ
ncbi:MAG: hybrid sensor histidine kinase/response regulator [Patescibacteria group bacterium]|nr:hybrid sensor histidine kinase/response regulator [Patescibacteria group bacterium]